MDSDEVLCELQPVSFPTKSAIYVWGYNHCGQIARKGKECHLRIPKQLSPMLFNVPGGGSLRGLDVVCGHKHTAAVASDGPMYTRGSNDYGQLGNGTEESAPREVKLLQTEFVKSVSCGAHCTAAIAEP